MRFSHHTSASKRSGDNAKENAADGNQGNKGADPARGYTNPYHHKQQEALQRKRQREQMLHETGNIAQKQYIPKSQPPPTQQQQPPQHQQAQLRPPKQSRTRWTKALSQPKAPMGKLHAPTLQLPTFSCLYTHQKLKKKKSWQDGEVRINTSQNRLCLYKVDEGNMSAKVFLESKYCLQEEMQRINSQEAEYIEFEKHLVEVDYGSGGDGRAASAVIAALPSANGGTTSACASIYNSNACSSSSSGGGGVTVSASRLKYKGFKVPSTVIRPTSSLTAAGSNSHGSAGPDGQLTNSSASVNSGVGGHYAIADDELDDIWDSTHLAEPTRHSPQVNDTQTICDPESDPELNAEAEWNKLPTNNYDPVVATTTGSGSSSVHDSCGNHPLRQDSDQNVTNHYEQSHGRQHQQRRDNDVDDNLSGDSVNLWGPPVWSNSAVVEPTIGNGYRGNGSGRHAHDYYQQSDPHHDNDIWGPDTGGGHNDDDDDENNNYDDTKSGSPGLDIDVNLWTTNEISDTCLAHTEDANTLNYNHSDNSDSRGVKEQRKDLFSF